MLFFSTSRHVCTPRVASTGGNAPQQPRSAVKCRLLAHVGDLLRSIPSEIHFEVLLNTHTHRVQSCLQVMKTTGTVATFSSKYIQAYSNVRSLLISVYPISFAVYYMHSYVSNFSSVISEMNHSFFYYEKKKKNRIIAFSAIPLRVEVCLPRLYV